MGEKKRKKRGKSAKIVYFLSLESREGFKEGVGKKIKLGWGIYTPADLLLIELVIHVLDPLYYAKSPCLKII